MRRLRGCLLVAFIFGCGFLAGGFVGAGFGWVGLFHKMVKGGPRAMEDIVFERAVHDLKLKPRQKEPVRRIIAETAHELAEATQAIQPRVDAIVSRGEERIAAELEPAQRAKFEKFVRSGSVHWKAAANLEGKPSSPHPGGSDPKPPETVTPPDAAALPSSPQPEQEAPATEEKPAPAK